MVQDEVELDGPLGPPELRPVEQAGAEIDHRGVQAQELVLEPELALPLRDGLAPAQQLEEDRLVQLPGPVRIRVGQRGPARSRDPQVAELPLAAGQPPADLPERLRPAQLAEEHGDELPPAGEAPGVALGLRVLDRPLELEAREELVEDLAEHAHHPTRLHG